MGTSNLQEKLGQNKWKILKNVLIYVGAAAAMSLLIVIVKFAKIPNPNLILVAGLIIITSMFGYGPGAVSAAGMLIYSVYFFSDDGSWIRFEKNGGEGLVKLIVSIVCVLLILAFVGHLRYRNVRIRNELAQINTRLKETNEELAINSATDTLTGVNNRLGFRNDFGSFVKQQLNVMVIDVDNFKHVNDTHGHVEGDRVLASVARHLCEAFGKESCYRYGGDEFLVILKDVSMPIFESKISQVEENISSDVFANGYKGVSISSGYAYGFAQSEDDLRAMMTMADENLYKAKQSGKARHCGSEYVNPTNS